MKSFYSVTLLTTVRIIPPTEFYNCLQLEMVALLTPLEFEQTFRLYNFYNFLPNHLYHFFFGRKTIYLFLKDFCNFLNGFFIIYFWLKIIPNSSFFITQILMDSGEDFILMTFKCFVPIFFSILNYSWLSKLCKIIS